MKSNSMPWWHPDSLSKRLPYLRQRHQVLNAIRDYFFAQGFEEVETPLLQATPGLDTHIMGFETRFDMPDADSRTLYLPTSPEFPMKKLLAGGMTKIFQITKSFRNRELSRLHHPEFTMMEWYRAHETYWQLMDDCIHLARAAAKSLQKRQFNWNGMTSDIFGVWQIISVTEAFQLYAGIDLLATTPDPHKPDRDLLAREATRIGIRVDGGDSWEDVFFRIFDDKIEKQLGHPVPTIIFDYPVSMAALSRPKPDNKQLCERFELYICGMELANAFGELTDPRLQRKRFVEDMDKKQALYGLRYPLDEDFLAMLEFGMPDSAGIALGVDRLVMLATGAEHITDVLWGPAV